MELMNEVLGHSQEVQTWEVGTHIKASVYALIAKAMFGTLNEALSSISMIPKESTLAIATMVLMAHRDVLLTRMAMFECSTVGHLKHDGSAVTISTR